ncbi:MAG: methyltransferase [Polyangiales bacterium]|nr:methyltransferase domain-containing protein [Myxococcales bacterium]
MAFNATDNTAADLTDDVITGSFRLYQRRRGHRYSIDDVLTAFVACRVAAAEERGVTQAMDLGTGIGSVLHMVAWKFPEAELVGIEAQTESIALARRNVVRNELAARVTLFEGDLRDVSLRDTIGGERFELVTGTPPYFPPGTAIPSPDAQRAHARIEYRGGVEAYLEAARFFAVPGAPIVLCAEARTADRVREAATRLGLVPEARLDAVPREGEPVLFSVWTLRHGVPARSLAEEPPFVARDRGGERTAQSWALREFFGVPKHARDKQGREPRDTETNEP